LRRPAGSIPQLKDLSRQAAEKIIERTLAVTDDSWLPPSEARVLLEAYGIPLVAEAEAAGPAEAGAAAARLGLPAVVKTAEAGVHKTERGGVALDLMSAADVEEAAARMGGAVVIQPMIAGGVELLAGIVQDPVFGPLVAFGPGGVFAELIGEAAFRIAPLTDIDADELVHAGKTGRLVSGFRGKPPADAAALIDLLHRVSRLAVDLPALAELDLNPVMALPSGCVTVDVRARVARPVTSGRLKTW
jgi:hypothetical protein